MTRRKVLKWGAAGLLVGGGVGVAVSRLARTERTLLLPRWKGGGLRVAHVSDVHLNNDGMVASAREAIRWAREAKPDLFVFTGDCLNHNHEELLANIRRTFADLDGIGCPCYAVLGNHDYWSKATARVKEEIAKTPLRLLVNQTVEFQGVPIVGLDDALGGNPDYALAAKEPSSLVLLHEPDYAENFTSGLVLSGHSHGGEICLPGGIPLYTPPGSHHYRSGYYDYARTPVYVNRGTATLGPGRVYCPPEVAILTLKSA